MESGSVGQASACLILNFVAGPRADRLKPVLLRAD